MANDTQTQPVGNYSFKTIEETPVLFGDWLDLDRVSELAAFLLEIESSLLELPRAPNWNDRKGNEITARYASYNVMILKHPATKYLYDVAKCCYREMLRQLNRPTESIYIQCWVNIARYGDSLESHAHPFPYHGHVTLQTEGSQTRYGIVSTTDIQNRPGLVTLVGGPGLVHSVPPYNGHTPRVSVAFDLLPASWVICDRYWRRVWEERTFIPFD